MYVGAAYIEVRYSLENTVHLLLCGFSFISILFYLQDLASA